MLLDEHGEGRNEHGVEFAGHALCKTCIVRSYHTQLFVLDPLLEGNDILGHVPDLLDGAAALDVEGVEDVLCLGTDGSLVGDIVGNGPHLLPVELLGIDEHSVVEIGLVNIEVHHARIGTAYLGDIGIAEAAAHLGSTAPVLYLCLHLRVATLDNSRDDCRTLAGTIQVGHHLADGTTGIELAQPGGDVGLGIVGGQLFLYVDNHDGHVEVAHGRQHIIRSAIGQHLQDDQVYIGCTELVACCHRLLLGGHHAAVNNLDGVGQRLLEGCILSLKLGYELRELWQVCLQRNAEHTYSCFGFY